MKFNLFGNKNKVIETKSLPETPSLRIESYINTAIPLSLNPKALISYNKGFVYDCNKLNSQTVASIPLKLYAISKSNGKKTIGDWIQHNNLPSYKKQYIKAASGNIRVKSAEDIVEITEHPFLELMSNVSDTMDNFSLFEITENYLGLLGNAFWKINKDKSGLPISIEVLPAEYITCILDINSKLIGYKMQIDGYSNPTMYEVDEVIHFKNIVAGAFRRINIYNQPITGLYGMGHAEAVIEEIELYNGINEYERTLAQNNSRPDMIIKYTNGKLEDSVAKKLTRQWNNIYRGNRNAGKISVMDNQFDVINLGFSPKDLSYNEGKKYLRTCICNAFGVREEFLSVENSNRASSQTAIEQYMRFTIQPKLRRIQETLNAALVSLYDDNLFCAYDNPVPEDFDSNVKKETSDIQNGIRTVNEIRADRGLEPIEGGDVLKTNNTVERVDNTIV